MSEPIKIYTGRCHCGAVVYTFKSPPIGSALSCNCTHCEKKGLLIVFIPKTAFTLKKGKDKLTKYSFKDGSTAHQICSFCGCEVFAFGKNKKGEENVWINIRCIDDIDLQSITLHHFDGKAI